MKKKILPALFTYLLFAMALNVNAQGGLLPLNGSVNGALVASTVDVWDVTTNADGLLRLTFTTVSPADLDVTLYDNDGTTAISGTTESLNNSTVIIATDGLSPGIYHVKISPHHPTDFGSYSLSDNLFTTAIANDVEPNGTAANASVLPLGGSKTGHLGYYYNNQRDTTDWYKVTTASDGLLRVYLATERGSVYSNNFLEADITLFDNDATTALGTVQVYDAGNPTTKFLTVDGLAPGTYYIKVIARTTADIADYTISDSLFTPPLANDAEPNGTAANASVLPLGGSKTGHLGYYYNNQRDTTDWYKVTTASDGLLRVYLATERGSVYSNNFLEADITLFDNDATTALGTVQVYDAGNPTTKFLTVDGLAPGTYYIKVIARTTADIADYTISDSLFTPPLANDAEPNGTAANASVLPLGGSKTGHLGYYYHNQRDTTDWYKVTTASDGLLRVYLATERGSVYSNNFLEADITLFDNDATTALGTVQVYDAGNPTTKFLTVDGLAPGTYYIKVIARTTADIADYTISDSLFTPPITNDIEPNGTVATAIAFPLNSVAKGHSGYYYNNQRDTADWYTLTTTTTGPLYVYLNSSRGSIYSNNYLDMRLTFYSSDGVTQLGSVEVYDNGNPAADSLYFPTLAAGKYYIKVINNVTSLFSNYSLSNSGTQGNLPVTFLNFYGRLIDNKAQLTWSTATEINNKGFQIQKSLDGHNFNDIGFVTGVGTSSIINTYNYTDAKVLSGFNYYRLKQIDFDGNFSYSALIKLDYSKFNWSIMGNPVGEQSWVQLQLNKAANISLQIISATGSIVRTITKGNIERGTYSIPLNLNKEAKGIYIVKLFVNNNEYTQKIIKVN